MKGLPRFLSLVLLALAALASAALADDPPAPAGGKGMHGLRRCLSQLDLSDDQKSQIQSAVDAARPGLQADRQALRADRQKLQADLTGGADACALGQDVLTRHADAAKMKGDAQALRTQVLARLTAQQQTTLQSCAQSSRGARHWGGPPAGQ